MRQAAMHLLLSFLSFLTLYAFASSSPGHPSAELLPQVGGQELSKQQQDSHLIPMDTMLESALLFAPRYQALQESERFRRKAEKNRRKRKGKGGRKGRKGRGEKKGRGKGRQGRKGKDKGRGREKIPTSGRFELESGHACTWMTMKTAQGLSQLQVTCQGLGASCLYEGKPEACRNYRRKAASYWAQAEAALKATTNPCHHNARLRPRVCRKGPTEALMHLITPQDGNGRVTAAVKGNVAKTDDDGDPKTQHSTSATQDGNSREAVMVGESDIPDPDEFAKKNCPERWQALCSFAVDALNG